MRGDTVTVLSSQMFPDRELFELIHIWHFSIDNLNDTWWSYLTLIKTLGSFSIFLTHFLGSLQQIGQK